MEGQISVMIADNNKELCSALGDHIGLQNDMELVAVAYDGLEAMEKIQAVHPEVLILDITMPYLDGIGVMERLQEISPMPKVIVLTAFEQEAMVQRMISMGAVYYMAKPFDTNTLLERVRQFGRDGQVKENRVVKEETAMYRSSVVRERTENDLEMKVSRIFHEMGIPAHFRGYAYLRDAIIMSVQEVELLGNITKHLYPRIAEKYRSTPSGVESAIRHTIEVGWQRGNPDYFGKIFGPGERGNKGKFPTTASFIAKIADRLRLENRYGVS
jgi:two-component system response regulator (stage 0 sporulation protein A)